jgi:hypothetical protein
LRLQGEAAFNERVVVHDSQHWLVERMSEEKARLFTGKDE